MNITPINLIHSWNDLDDIMPANQDPTFQAQAKRLRLKLRDEVEFWNSLSPEERVAIQDKEMEVHFEPISVAPVNYANDQIEGLSRFLADDIELKRNLPQMKKLMED